MRGIHGGAFLKQNKQKRAYEAFSFVPSYEKPYKETLKKPLEYS